MSKKYDSLGDRMKGYENIARNYLTRRIPTIIRVDGKAFHTFTRGMEKPFDRILMTTMQNTMKYLCENIQGCVFGYTQSDEITLVLTDYATITTDAWFGYNIQKMCSVSASMATLAFSNAYAAELWKNFPEAMCSSDNGTNKYIETLVAKMGTAMFDARVFSIPKDEVCNCLIWRQQDATRNSIESVGHANFSQKELHGKSCNSIQDMLWKERGINWNDFPVDCKRGSACYKTKVKETAPLLNDKGDTEMVEVVRNRWVIDREPPISHKKEGTLKMDMTPAEVATCICDIYEKLGRLECRLENTRGDLVTTIERNRQHTEEFLNQQTDIENKIDIALTTAVHELIEYLRYQDIQALDEEEFLLRVRELIRVEQDERLPF